MPYKTPTTSDTSDPSLPLGIDAEHQLDLDVIHRADRGPLLMVGRNSGDSKAARRAAVQDLMEAVEALRRMGWDLTDHLPSETELRSLLAEAPAATSTDTDGHRFTNRFLVLDLRTEANTVILLSTGSASKRRAEDGVQPFGHEMARVVWQYQTPLSFGKRVDRWTRDAWALADMAGRIAQLGGMVGDTVHGWRRVDGMAALMLFFHATVAEEDAKTTFTKTRGGMRSRTDDVMVAGRAAYGTAISPPPGLGLARLPSEDTDGLGDQILYIDGVGCQPSRDEAMYGVPDITDTNGEPVDQVAIVRWVLSVLGRPEWPRHRIAEKLAAWQFSHLGWRRQHGKSATYELPEDRRLTRQISRVFLSNLEFYRTGTLRLKLGHPGVEDPVIREVFPPDGPWLTEQDYQRIRRWEANKQSYRTGGMLLSGVSGRLNGTHDIALRTGTTQVSKALDKHTWYRMVDADGYKDGGNSTPDGAAPLPHRQFVESIITALAEAGTAPLALVRPVALTT